MARPNKEGLDYFPLDCKLDDKVYMVEVELGLEGFALFIKLLMKIYNENYYIEWTERKAKIFAKQNNTNMDVINSLINICLNEGLFNKKLYKKYHILTSNGIQKRYFHSIKNRKDIYVIKEYLIDGISNYLDNLDNVNLNSINSNINPVNDKHNPHSIVKDSIVKNNKEKKAIDFIKVWKDFKEMRKKIRKPMTDKAEELILKELNKLDNNEDTQIAILNQSIMNSWQGVFPLKANKDDGFEYQKYEPKKVKKLTRSEIEKNKENITRSKERYLEIVKKKKKEGG